MISFLAGGGILGFLFLDKVFTGADIFVQHGPMLILGMLLSLFGLQFLATGLVGELMMRNYFEAHQKPVYRLERIMNSARVTDARR